MCSYKTDHTGDDKKMKAATREPESVHKRTIEEFNYVSTSLILASNLWAV